MSLNQGRENFRSGWLFLGEKRGENGRDLPEGGLSLKGVSPCCWRNRSPTGTRSQTVPRSVFSVPIAVRITKQIPHSLERGIRMLWAYLDLNQGPLPYQGSALTKLSYRPEGFGIVSARSVVDATPGLIRILNCQPSLSGWTSSVVELRGFEPLTPWLQTRCSAKLSYSPGVRVVYAQTGNDTKPKLPAGVRCSQQPGDSPANSGHRRRGTYPDWAPRRAT